MGKLVLHGDVYYQTLFFFSNVAGTVGPFASIRAYTLVNARVSWADIMKSAVTASFFVTNLANKKYFGGGNPVGATLGVNTAVPGRPRMVGGELRFDF